MNSVLSTTLSSVYLAIKHVFPEVPINAGTFEPLRVIEPEGTFLYAKYPRPVSGCAAEVSQRIAEAVFSALVHAMPRELFAAPTVEGVAAQESFTVETVGQVIGRQDQHGR